MFNDLTSTRPGVITITLGAIPTIIGFVWGWVIGYYPGQLPIILVLIFVGLGLLAVGQRMYQSAQRNIALQRIAARDAAASEGR